MSNKTKIVAIPKTTTTTATFSPTSIAGCQLWLDASDTTTLTLSGSTITQWRDKVINLQLSVGSGTNTLTQNAFGNMQAISFNGGYLVSPSSVFTATENVNNINQFVIMKRTANTAYGLVAGIGFYTQNTKNSIYINANQAQIVVRRGITTNSSRYDGPLYDNTINQGYIYSALTDYQASTYQLIINGSTNAATTFGGTGTTTNDTSLIYVGSTNFNEPFYGYVAEYIIYNTALSATNRQTIESYLAQKWGMTASLPAGHPGLTTSVYTITAALPKQKISSIPKAAAFTNFVPTSVAGCQMWLDAMDTTKITPSAGGTLTAWLDKSGTNKTISINSAPTYVTTGFNGTYPYMNFPSGANLSLTIPSIGTGDVAIFAVWKETVSGAQNNIFSIGSPASGGETAVGWNGGELLYKFYRYGGPQGQNSTLSYNTNVITSALQLSGVRSVYVNGYNPTGTGSENYNQTNTTAYIGGGGFPLVGSAAEIIFYIGTLTSTQRQTIESYLAQKWGLTSSLAPGHPGLTTTVYGTTTATVKQKISAIVPVLTQYIQTFSYTGSNQTFTVPSRTTSIAVYMWGAGGAGSGNAASYQGVGGAGAYITGNLSVTSPSTLTIIVGGGGAPLASTTVRAFGGGGIPEPNSYNVSGGGGRSAIQVSGTDVVTAGAGGGGVAYGTSPNGAAGSWTTSIINSAGSALGGGGGSTTGGTAGSNPSGAPYINTDGSLNLGGLGSHYGGAGGSGYYGGGGGGCGSGITGAGGGGSSLTTNMTNVSGANSSDGYAAPNTVSPYYQSGVASGGAYMTAGGNGLVVLVYMA